MMHVAPPAQRVAAVPTAPHGWPLAAIGWVTQILIAVSHASPAFGSQSGPVLRVGSHVVAAVEIRCMQLPIAVIVEPTHASEAPQGRSRLHAPASSTGGWHDWVLATQLIVGPHPWFAHDAPASGGAMHVPHSAPLATAQN